MVFCKKLNQELEGLTSAPYPGQLGEQILASISRKAWSAWLGHQTMLINEHRLTLIDPDARKFLETEMQRFLFSGEASQPPAGFTAVTDNTPAEDTVS